MMRLVAVAGNSCLTISSLIVLLTICWLAEVRSLSTLAESGKLPQSFFLVEVGPPNSQSAAFVGRLDSYVFALTKIFKCRTLFRRKVGKFGVAIEIKFIDVVTAFVNKKI